MIDCRNCGVCCSYSEWWPALKQGDKIERSNIPDAFVHSDGTRMLSNENRCTALQGSIGQNVKCDVYHVRPHSCRAFRYGGVACLMVRIELGIWI
ncbi:MAG: YkgJ family cysteine cluster protein [Rhodospirillaceae bacterium]